MFQKELIIIVFKFKKFFLSKLVDSNRSNYLIIRTNLILIQPIINVNIFMLFTFHIQKPVGNYFPYF